MINIQTTSLRNTSAEYFLYCKYSARPDKGNCIKEGCKFNSGSYSHFFKRKQLQIVKGIIFTPIPIYKPEFIGKRELVFRYGTIFITDSLTTEKEKDYSYLLDKKLFLAAYRTEHDVQVALMVNGAYKRRIK